MGCILNDSLGAKVSLQIYLNIRSQPNHILNPRVSLKDLLEKCSYPKGRHLCEKFLCKENT